MDKLNLGKLAAAFTQMRPRLEAAARARTGCRATAEDLIQDTWLKLEASSTDQPISNPGGFIAHIARYTVIDHLRKERRRSEIDAEVSGILWDGMDEVSPDRVLDGKARLCAVLNALREMPERTRTIFLMNRLDRVPHRRIAEQFGISDEAVYYHIRRALERLAQVRDAEKD
ncbi:DNA-directed RNA polymerase sigma-70 factor [Azorhizobium oxalatiphilum]|uniref:DNA-directed RNA polymerase sigma-70 factor n=1 Tax=Azorhizobium oxalatiphilum TaxID=980631 RepID=A0A917C6Z8_9HYPH|nr:RNA polymerase sigma factor [Azorhizobium oxalatiphilum]GGF75111.1 DNA-directed RNA polymerase sigma-70 factor [Azorhizobium oxalatiphilum]